MRSKCLACVLLLVAAGQAQASLIISEYIEGSSNNKALELYNTSGVDLDLSGYTVKAFHNGRTQAQGPSFTFNLSGTVSAGDVFVLANTNAVQAILDEADLISGNVSFNGDDAIELLFNDVVIDSFGQVGVDPGSSWDVDSQNITLRRLDTILTGDTNSSDAFTTATEWVEFANDTFVGLGSHSVIPEPATMILLGLGGLLYARRRF